MGTGNGREWLTRMGRPEHTLSRLMHTSLALQIVATTASTIIAGACIGIVRYLYALDRRLQRVEAVLRHHFPDIWER